jgi:hypothetical protein
VNVLIESCLATRGLAHCLEYYDIPKSQGFRALRDLALMNITPATLFPDLQGAATQANIHYFSLRNIAEVEGEVERIAKMQISKGD